MQDIIMRIAGPGAQQEQLRLQLIKRADPSCYTEDLLSRVLCSVNSTAPELKERFTLQQHSSQSEVRHVVCCAGLPALLRQYNQIGFGMDVHAC
jgi:hypothetical protein